MQPYDYTWILVLGFLIAFFDAFGIGANDVANAFATSVSSRALSLKQAVIIACFTEFLGAALLGSSVTKAIKEVIRADLFEDVPEVLMLVMLCSLVGSSTWVIFASGRGWPVSTTHATIGGLSGAAIAAFGTRGIDWGFNNGIARIVMGWFLSPVSAGVVGALIFIANRFLILDRREPYKRATRIVPFWFGVAAFIYAHYLVDNAPAVTGTGEGISEPITLAISAGAMTLVTAWAFMFYVPWVNRVLEGENMRWWHLFYTPLVRTQPPPASSLDHLEAGAADTSTAKNPSDLAPPTTRTRLRALTRKALRPFISGLHQNVVTHEGDKAVTAMHAISARFDPRTEDFFAYLQVFTAMLSSFAHGSNDVADAVGPLSTIYSIWRTGRFEASVATPLWMVLYTGLAIDVGLITYGYHVMSKLGNKITFQTPTRGFATELGASLTVLTASRLHLPVSTTHALVGATTGVGIASNRSVRAVNWKVLAEAFGSWVFTLPAAGLVSAAIFAFAAYSPTLVGGQSWVPPSAGREMGLQMGGDGVGEIGGRGWHGTSPHVTDDVYRRPHRLGGYAPSDMYHSGW